jgi:hypothetical protein
VALTFVSFAFQSIRDLLDVFFSQVHVSTHSLVVCPKTAQLTTFLVHFRLQVLVLCLQRVHLLVKELQLSLRYLGVRHYFLVLAFQGLETFQQFVMF